MAATERERTEFRGALRPNQRAKTAPALEANRMESGRLFSEDDSWGEIRTPDTPEVRNLIQSNGPVSTLLDVALGVADLFLESSDINHEYVYFLKDCLRAGHERTSLPCALLNGMGAHDDEVQDYLLRTYANTGTPKSVRSTKTRSASGSAPGYDSTSSDMFARTPSPDVSLPVMCFNSDGAPVTAPRWPGGLSRQHSGVSSELSIMFEGDHFDTWSFDIFTVSRLSRGQPLLFTGWEVLYRGDFFTEFCIKPDAAGRFLKRIESTYGDHSAIPYHNSLHAADVTQLVHALLGDIGFGEYFDRIGSLALLVSAMIHDVAHDGRNTAFHVIMRDELALTYNDRSPLENYHLAVAFRVLSNEPDANLFSGLTKDQLTRIRREMIESVLGTDMAFHFDKVNSLRLRLESPPEDWGQDSAALQIVQVMVLHAADTSTPAKPAFLSEQWTELLRQEFFLQGDAERALQVPVSPMCDRDTFKFAKSQVGFIQIIVQPTFALLAELVPKVETTILVEIATNLAVWEERKRLEEAEEEEKVDKAATDTSQEEKRQKLQSEEKRRQEVATTLPLAPRVATLQPAVTVTADSQVPRSSSSVMPVMSPRHLVVTLPLGPGSETTRSHTGISLAPFSPALRGRAAMVPAPTPLQARQLAPESQVLSSSVRMAGTPVARREPIAAPAVYLHPTTGPVQTPGSAPSVLPITMTAVQCQPGRLATPQRHWNNVVPNGGSRDVAAGQFQVTSSTGTSVSMGTPVPMGSGLLPAAGTQLPVGSGPLLSASYASSSGTVGNAIAYERPLSPSAFERPSSPRAHVFPSSPRALDRTHLTPAGVLPTYHTVHRAHTPVVSSGPRALSPRVVR